MSSGYFCVIFTTVRTGTSVAVSGRATSSSSKGLGTQSTQSTSRQAPVPGPCEGSVSGGVSASSESKLHLQPLQPLQPSGASPAFSASPSSSWMRRPSACRRPVWGSQGLLGVALVDRVGTYDLGWVRRSCCVVATCYHVS